MAHILRFTGFILRFTGFILRFTGFILRFTGFILRFTGLLLAFLQINKQTDHGKTLGGILEAIMKVKQLLDLCKTYRVVVVVVCVCVCRHFLLFKDITCTHPLSFLTF